MNELAKQPHRRIVEKSRPGPSRTIWKRIIYPLPPKPHARGSQEAPAGFEPAVEDLQSNALG